MSSRRLPGKILKQVNGQPLLGYLFERLKHVQELNDSCVLTSKDPSDNPVQKYCETQSIHCFRGSLDNVAERFSLALETFPTDVFIRISGDSPLLDIYLIEKGIEIFEQEKPDIVTNVLNRSYPKGQSIELLSSKAYQEYFPQIVTRDDQEHVTPWFYRNKDKLRITTFTNESDASHVQLSVDSHEDFENFQHIIAQMNRPHWEYSWQEMVQLHQSTNNPPLCN